LAGALFADPSLSNNGNELSLCTAYQTFCGASFPALINLNISNGCFTPSKVTGTGSLSINTAEETFKDAEFTSLTELNFKGVAFDTPIINNISLEPVTNITLQQKHTAKSTFDGAVFYNLNNLSLGGARFGGDLIIGMDNLFVKQEYYTADNTFSRAHFLAPVTLDLSNTDFGFSNLYHAGDTEKDNGCENVRTACQTFSTSEFK
jgi:hypothetical protein